MAPFLFPSNSQDSPSAFSILRATFISPPVLIFLILSIFHLPAGQDDVPRFLPPSHNLSRPPPLPGRVRRYVPPLPSTVPLPPTNPSIFSPVTIAIIAALSTHPSTSIGLSPSIHFLFFAIATAALCLIPIALHALNKVHFVSDAVIALFWLIVYAIVVHFFNLLSCGSAWNWGTITKGGMCGRWTAVIAVAFLSIVFWAITAGMVSF